MSNLRNPNKAYIECWKDLAEQVINGDILGISLLKGITLKLSSGENITIYAKRDHKVLAAPGHNAETITIDRFNFVEVSQYIYINKYTCLIYLFLLKILRFFTLGKI